MLDTFEDGEHNEWTPCHEVKWSVKEQNRRSKTSPPKAGIKPANSHFSSRGSEAAVFGPTTMLDWAVVQKLIVGVATLAILVAVAFYLAGKIRAAAIQKEPSGSELLTKFRELHSRGVLSDEEFRTIKTTLTERLQAELRGKDETG